MGNSTENQPFVMSITACQRRPWYLHDVNDYSRCVSSTAKSYHTVAFYWCYGHDKKDSMELAKNINDTNIVWGYSELYRYSTVC